MARVERERAQFRRLLVSNPNYFGNLKGSELSPVKKIAGDTTYEELSCVGLNPDTDRLEATVHVKRSTGYGGSDLCAPGSTEYVRFFLDYGSGWEDAGVAAFAAHDVPDRKECHGDGDKPLVYVVTQTIDPRRKPCKTPVLPKVRAILSWNQEPPAGDATFTPVWGNVLDRHVQIRKRTWLIKEVFDLADIAEVPKELFEFEEQPIPLPDPPELGLEQLVAAYEIQGKRGAKKLSVEPHRLGFAQIQALIEQSTASPDLLAANAATWKKLGLDLFKAVGELGEVQGNVSYEELDCLGLDVNREQLVATFRVKKASGYSGGPCTNGSLERVAFWADWDDGCEWEYLGTAEMRVRDFPIPVGGLHYAAILPVNLLEARSSCKRAKVGRVRAVLSWSSPPSTSDPDAVPFWGNRIDAHVQLPPGPKVSTVAPLFHRIGGIRDDDIDNSTGLTTPTALFDNGFPPDGLLRPCPFAGRVVITGPPFPGNLYRVQVRQLPSGGWTSVANPFVVQPLVGPAYTKSPVLGDYFSYEAFLANPDLTLAWWQSGGDELWEVKLDILGVPGSVVQRVQLKNSGVEDAQIDIAAGGNCGRFAVGATLNGTFVARDPYLGAYSLGTSPFAAPAGQLVPTGGTSQTPVAGSPWTLDTTGMAACGYVVNLHVRDRAIVNSHGANHHRNAAVGFCLLNPEDL